MVQLLLCVWFLKKLLTNDILRETPVTSGMSLKYSSKGKEAAIIGESGRK